MPVKQNTIKIGTRGSQLALKQTQMVCSALHNVHKDLNIEIITIKTSGDWLPEHGEVPLQSAAGGKAQFAGEIQDALIDGTIDMAVHSMKDMDSILPDQLVIDCFLPRVDPRDCLVIHDIAKSGQNIASFSQHTTVGTVSPRRAAFMRQLNPDLEIVPFRGNITTRIDKVKNGHVDVTILAMAGLKRLDLEKYIDVILSPDMMLPAAGQGTVGIERRKDDQNIASLLSPINCIDTKRTITVERSVLRALNASCHTPVAVPAPLKDKGIRVRAKTLDIDGSKYEEIEDFFDFLDIDALADASFDLGVKLKNRTPASWLTR